MAESPEGSRLSGLARSIDALFAAPPAAAPQAVPPRPAEPVPASQTLAALPEPPAAPPAEPAPAEVPAEDFDPLLSFESPWSEPLAAEPGAGEPGAWPPIDAPDPMSGLEAGRPVAPEPRLEEAEASAEPVTPGEPTPHGGPAAPAEPATHGEPTTLGEPAPLGEPATSLPSTPSVGPAASVEPAAPVEHAAPDADGFLAAVAAYVAGDREQRERIETLAVGLRERLALDPLSDAVETLVREAGDPPDRTYIALATAVMNPAVASRLVQRMGRERDDAKREEYTTLCRRLGLVMVNGLKGALTGALEPSVRRRYRDTLLSMGPVSRPVIEAMVEDENRFLARDAVVMLAEIGGERAVLLVTSALANSDPRVRAEALHALGELGDVESGRLTLGFLDDSDANVRVAAAVAAGKLGVERALRPLLQLLEQEVESDTRARLLEALGNLGDPGAVPAIEKHATPGLFAKSSTDERVAAYKALHRIGTPHARELVQRAANDKDPAVRAALRGLVRED